MIRGVLAAATGSIAAADAVLDALEEHGLAVRERAAEEPVKLQVEEVWQAYAGYHPRARLDDKRRRLIKRRLGEGHPAGVLVAAIHGNHRSPWHCGENPDGREYHDLGLILRNADTIERFAGITTTAALATPADKVVAGRKLTARDLAALAAGGGERSDARGIGGFAELVRPQLEPGR